MRGMRLHIRKDGNEVTLKEVSCEGVDSMKWFRTGSTDGLT
jgi:hypothetical protein